MKSKFAHISPADQIVGKATNADYRKQGARAHAEGFKRVANPYYETSTAGEQWDKGYNTAADAAEEALLDDFNYVGSRHHY